MPPLNVPAPASPARVALDAHTSLYVKGPDGLPLKSADKVFRVAR